MMMGIKGPGRPGPYDLLGMFYIIRRDKACLVRLIEEGTKWSGDPGHYRFVTSIVTIYILQCDPNGHM